MNMNEGDFEVHESGTASELKALRSLVNEINAIEKQYPGVTPHSIMKKHKEVLKHYAKNTEY